MKNKLIRILLICFMLSSNCFADPSISEAKEKNNEVQNKLNEVDKKKKEETKKIEESKKTKEGIEAEAKSKDEEYNNTLAEIEKIDNSIKDLDLKIVDAEKKYDELSDKLKSRVRVLYTSSNNYFFDLVVGAKSIFDFIQKLEMLSKISEKDKKMLNEFYMSKKEIEQNKLLSSQLKIVKENSAKTAKLKLDELNKSKKDLNVEIEKRRDMINFLEQEESKLEKQSNELKKIIQKSQSSTLNYSGGVMLWPSNDSHSITSSYGSRYHPILRTYKMHTGIDIGAGYGSSVLAANSGRVIGAEYNNAYGKMIIIDHGGGISTLYAHLSSMYVLPGDRVSRGQSIGAVGSTGWSTGAHLHFEVRKDGATLNPIKYVN